MRVTRFCAASLAVVMFPLGCATDDVPPVAPVPSVPVSSEIVAAAATTALGDDAVVDVRVKAGQPVEASLLGQLAPIAFGEGQQWLGRPRSETDAPSVGSPDPSFWLDPDRVVQAARSIAATVELDDAARARTDERLAALRETMRRADEQVQALLVDLPPERRVVATDNLRLGYFAERYGLQILPSEGAGPLGDLDLDRLGPPGSPTATLDGLIVEVARRVASPEG